MISCSRKPTIGLLASGGLDSSILLGHLLDTGERVQPFYVSSGLVWEEEERRALDRYLDAMACPELKELVVLDMPLADLYRGHWSMTGRDVPDADSPDDAVYLPGRNALLVIKPLVWCRLNGIEQLALAPLGSNPFADATTSFFAEFESALNRATMGDVRIVRPFAGYGKRQVMELGRNYPLELTFSCIQPHGRRHCGGCNKCAERRAAFRAAGIDDRTAYFNTEVETK